MKAPIICTVTNSTESCACDRIEPMWSLSLKEECGFDQPERPLATGAYTEAELAAVPPRQLVAVLQDLSACAEFHEDNILGEEYPLKGIGAANKCEKHHLFLYKRDIAVLRALLNGKEVPA